MKKPGRTGLHTFTNPCHSLQIHHNILDNIHNGTDIECGSMDGLGSYKVEYRAMHLRLPN